ncbi:MAG: hypothetical protein LBP27_03165 [Treponema sp.]|jgi:hypothetical protein|nr:hypothetical protein [Treponema sp.]
MSFGFSVHAMVQTRFFTASLAGRVSLLRVLSLNSASNPPRLYRFMKEYLNYLSTGFTIRDTLFSPFFFTTTL